MEYRGVVHRIKNKFIGPDGDGGDPQHEFDNPEKQT